jgi:protease-4
MEITHESVFVSAIRSFCKTFCGLVGIFLALLVGAIFYSLFASPYQPQEKTTLTILPDLNRELALKPFNSPVILQINIQGVIGEPSIDTKTMDAILLDSRRGLLANNRVKAILINFNTPGGTVFDSDNIYRMLKAYKEKYNVPIYGYVSGLCASGGVYISSSCDKIFGAPCSIIGSVGVVLGPFFNIVEGLNKLGVQAKVLSDGLNKDMMSPFRPWAPDEDASLRAIMDFQYNRFVDIVSATHPRLTKEKLINEYGAAVFDVVKAQEFGYIDVANANYEDALQALMLAASIDPQHPYQVIELIPTLGLFGFISSSQSPLRSGKIEHEITLSGNPAYKIRDQFAYLYLPGGAQ